MKSYKLKELFFQALRFGLVGLLNTAITYLTFWVIYKKFNGNEYLANITGYILGIINSFFLNKAWTFRSKGFSFREPLIFMIIFMISYGIQLVIYSLLRRWGLRPEYAEWGAMGFYTIVNFAGNKWVTFNKRILKDKKGCSPSPEGIE